MNIFNGYKYLLYRVYAWQLALFGEKQNPKFVAIVGCSLFIFFNIETVIVVFQIFSGYDIYIPDLYAVIAMVCLILLNSYIFLYRNEFEKLIEEFSKETESQRKKNTVWCLAYVILTHVVFFLSVIILSPSTR